MSTFKVVRFLAREAACSPDELRARWTETLARRTGAGACDPSVAGGPFRVALALPLDLPELDLPAPDLPAPPCAAVELQWFAAAGDALDEAWLRSVAPGLCTGSDVLGATRRVVAEEVVLRGRDWLDARWASGGERCKMMSFGRRDPRLTPAQFSARWRGEAGRLGGEAIPDDVRGLAYVQNHPVPLDGHEWPFDAVNEVWFERVEDLRRRAAWFAARQEAALRAPGAPFLSPTETWSAYLREIPLGR